MAVAVMVSMVAFLDSTAVNLALPATIRDLGGGMTRTRGSLTVTCWPCAAIAPVRNPVFRVTRVNSAAGEDSSPQA